MSMMKFIWEHGHEIVQINIDPDNYDEDKIDEWNDKNIDRVRDNGYGWKYLYQTCIKEDAPEYYDKLIIQKIPNVIKLMNYQLLMVQI